MWPGAIILRGEGLPADVSGSIGVTYSANSPLVPLAQLGKDLFDILVHTGSRPVGDNHWCARLHWTPNEFSGVAALLEARPMARATAAESIAA